MATGRKSTFLFWNLNGRNLSEAGRVPGTYFYSEGAAVARFWHMFDQVLRRSELLPGFTEEDVEIGVRAGCFLYLTATVALTGATTLTTCRCWFASSSEMVGA